MSILILKPIFKKRIWGSTYFKDELYYDLDNELYGELWSLSAHNEGETLIINGRYKGFTLSKLYIEHQELFNTKSQDFPLMVKMIHAKNDLSIQVHPDDEYALINEKQYGKTECWYFLETKKDASIVFGHHAKNKEEMKQSIENGTCETLLDYKKVKKDDFALIESHTIHALKSGLLLLEIQQSSDVTYRLYDYNRIDKNGKKRELHVNKALDVIDFPQKKQFEIIDTNKIPYLTNNIKSLTKCKYFNVEKWDINKKGNYKLTKPIFHIFTVASGHFIINDGIEEYKLNLGESFIVCADESELNIEGTGSILISYCSE